MNEKQKFVLQMLSEDLNSLKEKITEHQHVSGYFLVTVFANGHHSCSFDSYQPDLLLSRVLLTQNTLMRFMQEYDEDPIEKRDIKLNPDLTSINPNKDKMN